MSQGQILIDLYHHLYEKSKLRSFLGGKIGHQMTFVTLKSMNASNNQEQSFNFSVKTS